MTSKALIEKGLAKAEALVKKEQKASPGESKLDFDLRMMKLSFDREFKFHPDRRWKVDFALHEHKLAVEVEGAVWAIGRHQRPAGFIADMEKYNILVLMGWRLLRFSTEDVMRGRAITMILAAVGQIPVEAVK